jgi:hypothetical protein
MEYKWLIRIPGERAGGVAQVVREPVSKCEALSSKPSAIKKLK